MSTAHRWTLYFLTAVVYILIAVVISLISLCTEPARAYDAGRMGRWDHVAITHDGNPLVSRALDEWAKVSGIRNGGVSANPDIRVRVLNPWPYGSNILGAAGITGNGSDRITGCEIDLPDESFLGVLVHEVGHCLGLGHSADRNANMYPSCCSPINADDVAGIRTLYGPPVVAPPPPVPPVTYRRWLPSLGKD